MKRVLAQTRKELRQLVRDRLALALVLLLPVIQLMLMGSSMSMTVRDLPIVVQDLDDSPTSRALLSEFRASQTFRIVAWPPDRKPEDAFTHNSARAAVRALVRPPAHASRMPSSPRARTAAAASVATKPWFVQMFEVAL